MKIKIVPVRRMKKGRTWVWVPCDQSMAQAYELHVNGKMKRREHSMDAAKRVVMLYSRAKSQPAKDRRQLVGKRWEDVKDRL